ncbi:MAG: hypothetical protein D6713_09450 [Deltaproteobacteria bacterium]|nr:MAG: hypothetical protein D6713_09450 [Deltaproteobacteria bacterium]
MTGTKEFLKLLEMLVDEEERTRALREYLEEKTSCTVRLDRLGIPGITENFEIHNLKMESAKKDFRFNAELIRFSSSQLATIITAGKILLNSDSDIPVENLDIYGLYTSIGDEENPSFELFVREAHFAGVEFKIRYDQAQSEPVFSGTISTKDAPSEITLRFDGVEVPVMEGNISLTFNLKTLTGRVEVTAASKRKKEGEKEESEKKPAKEKKKEKVSLDSLNFTVSAEFTLFPYLV